MPALFLTGDMKMKAMKFEKYVRSSILRTVIVTAALSITCLTATYFVFFRSSDRVKTSDRLIIMLVFWGIASMIYYIVCGAPLHQLKRRKKDLEERDLLKAADDEFEMADSYFGNTLRVSETFVYCKGRGLIIPARDLICVKRMRKITRQGNGASSSVWWVIGAEYDNDNFYRQLCAMPSEAPPDWERLTEKLEEIAPRLAVEQDIVTDTIQFRGER